VNTMTADQVRSVLALISGYHPTPALSEEEIIAWTTELVGPYRMTYAEVVYVIKAEKGRQWRPRPGELVGLVQHYRRQEALRHPRPALEGDRPCSREATLAHIAECKAILVGSEAGR